MEKERKEKRLKIDTEDSAGKKGTCFSK